MSPNHSEMFKSHISRIAIISQSAYLEWDSTSIICFVSTLLSAVFLLSLPAKLLRIRSTRSKASQSRFVVLKSVSSIAFLLSIILSACSVKLLILPPTPHWSLLLSLLASALAALGLSLLLILEQSRTAIPSDLITLYLITSIPCDILLLTVPSGVHLRSNASRPVLGRCIVQSLLLVMQCWVQRPTSNGLEKSRSPEESNGLLSRVFFTWINPILIQGYRNLLVDQDLPPLSTDMRPKLTRRAMLRSWDQRRKPENKRTLPLALLICLKTPFIAAVVPRLFLIVFRYSQPILIRQSVRFVTMPTMRTDRDHGYWLIVSAITVYIGLAISTGIYQHRLNRIKLMIRGALVGLIHDKTLNSPSITYDDGASTTLMSTDADSLDGIGEMFHETWAQVLEVTIGLILLAREVGWIWPLPLFLIFLCSRVSRYVAKHLQARQKGWNVATQARVAATSSMLASMKTIKMLGFQEHLANRIQSLREAELFAASKLRWMMVYYNASANALGIFTPAITLVMYAIIARFQERNLDVETAFTTMAILSMVTHPANMVMTIVPRAVGTLAAFDRIQTFLLRPSLHDCRETLSESTYNATSMGLLSEEQPVLNPAIQIQDITIGDRQPILENMNMAIPKSSLTIISGPVGTGKTTLLRAILGEMTPARGTIKISTRKIAYCAQRPWLPSGTIKGAILGTSTLDDGRWYDDVTELCCLKPDFKALRDGDRTLIGSRGLNLSGGQRQRVALARALYARCEIVLLDDSFSGLDGETERTIFNNLFSQTGLFRRLSTTVVLVSNSTQYFHHAEQVIILGDHSIIEQGPWSQIQNKTHSLHKFMSSSHETSNAVLTTSFDKLSAQIRASDEAETDLSRQMGDLALYGYYFHFAGLTNCLSILAWTSTYSFFITFPQYWLQLWTQGGDGNEVFYICGFMFLAFMAWSTTSVGMWATIIRLAPRSGLRLHERLLRIVACAPLSFFSKTDNGSILNRFSQDIQLIDKQLPPAFSNLTVQTLKLLSQATLLCITQPYLSLSLPACTLILYLIQKIYLRTSRQLRFLELESRATVFSSFLETIEGLEILRAFASQPFIKKENIKRVDDSQRPEFLLLSLQRWLNIVLDLLAAAIAVSIVVFAVVWGEGGAQVGVALNLMLVVNSTLLKLVENWTTVEISLGAVARLRGLERGTPAEDVKLEGGGEADGEGLEVDVPENWPKGGRLEFRDVCAGYSPTTPILHNITLTLRPGTKTTICGRTGSGKSSLLLTLLRLLRLHSGTILLDSLPLSQIPLRVLRERAFVTIAQDALVLMGESLRFNLGPEGGVADDILHNSLRKVGLSFLIEQVRGDGNARERVLDEKMNNLPQLSSGQCQLFAMARALINVESLTGKGIRPVVLLDEVTASLDVETERVVDRVVEEEFVRRGLVVCVVRHRVGGDEVEGEVEGGGGGGGRVVVLSEGQVVSCGEEMAADESSVE